MVLVPHPGTIILWKRITICPGKKIAILIVCNGQLSKFCFHILYFQAMIMWFKRDITASNLLYTQLFGHHQQAGDDQHHKRHFSVAYAEWMQKIRYVDNSHLKLLFIELDFRSNCDCFVSFLSMKNCLKKIGIRSAACISNAASI